MDNLKNNLGNGKFIKLVRQYGFKPKKFLGQNFLINEKFLEKIISTAEIKKSDSILEIGAGFGNLTEKLIKKNPKNITALEKDTELVKILRNKFKGINNLKIINKDVLNFSPTKFFNENNYKVIGNPPYYLTSKLLRIIFEKWPKPKLIVFTLQKEVAERIITKPPKMNILALSVQFFSKPKIIAKISKENFWPIPKVDSAIIRLIPFEKEPVNDKDNLFKIIKTGFSSKRKFLINNLSKKLTLEKERFLKIFKKLSLDQKIRAENLSLVDWINLTKEIDLSG